MHAHASPIAQPVRPSLVGAVLRRSLTPSALALGLAEGAVLALAGALGGLAPLVALLLVPILTVPLAIRALGGRGVVRPAWGPRALLATAALTAALLVGGSVLQQGVGLLVLFFNGGVASYLALAILVLLVLAMAYGFQAYSALLPAMYVGDQGLLDAAAESHRLLAPHGSLYLMWIAVAAVLSLGLGLLTIAGAEPALVAGLKVAVSFAAWRIGPAAAYLELRARRPQDAR